MYRMIRLFFICFFLPGILSAQAFRTQELSPEIYSVEVKANGSWNAPSVINLNSEDRIHIDFDFLSDYLSPRLRYRLVNCNADWTENSSLSSIEYIDGFNDNPIENYKNSVNTTVLYTHYKLEIPNEDISLKLSGNYAVIIYDEDEGEDRPLLTACFSVLDNQVNIVPQVSSTTDIDSNSKHHQLSFDLNYSFPIRDIQKELAVYARQNNRLDNARGRLQPTYIMPSKLSYAHNKDLIFEAGNEYHRFETSSRRSNGRKVNSIEYINPYYHVHLAPDNINKEGSYLYDQDQNGRVIYRNLDAPDAETEGDYFYTYFYLNADGVIADEVYMNGSFTNNTFSDKYKMLYDEEQSQYYQVLLLKQGIYNYQYLTQKGDQFSAEEVDGNFYETENEYSIYVYHRPVGSKYDKLIGFSSIQSRNK